MSGSSQEHVISGAFAYCYAGTLGSLVSNKTNLFILSNNHVLAKENQPDNTVLSANGNLIVQPALLDRDPCPGLNADLTNDRVAFGVSYVPLQFCRGKTCPVNTVDAATESALKKGQLYVNVHTINNTGGEIRGQIIPVKGK